MGFLTNATVDALTDILPRAVDGERPPTDPVERAARYDWDRVAADALTAYRAAVDGGW